MRSVISKTEFKARASKIMREIEKTGKATVITTRGKPVLEIRKFRQSGQNPLRTLKGSVLKFDNPIEPGFDDEFK